MTTKRPRYDHAVDLFCRILAGGRAEASDIDRLLDGRVPEDLHLDYKAGSLFEQEKGTPSGGAPMTFAGKLRKYVAGLANGDGGLLVFGVGEAVRTDPATNREVRDPQGRRPVMPVRLPKDDAVDRVHQAVASLRPYLSRAPVVCPVDHPEGLVILVAVPRSDALVVCVEANQSVHYLRIGDNTVSAPGYLVEDLVLGRRRRVALSVTASVTLHLPRQSISFALQVVNQGLVWADDLRAGVIVPSSTPDGSLSRAGLEQMIRVVPGSRLLLAERHAIVGLPKSGFGPFDAGGGSVSDLSLAPLRGPFRLWCGLYVVARDQPASWYQLDVFAPPEAPDRVRCSCTPAEDLPVQVGILGIGDPGFHSGVGVTESNG